VNSSAAIDLQQELATANAASGTSAQVRREHAWPARLVRDEREARQRRPARQRGGDPRGQHQGCQQRTGS